MTRIDLAMAIACISILLCSVYAAPPIIPKAHDSSVSIRAEFTSELSQSATVTSAECPVDILSSPSYVATTSKREYRLMCVPSTSNLFTGPEDADVVAGALCRAMTQTNQGGNVKGIGDWMLAKISNNDELNKALSLTSYLAGVNTAFNKFGETTPRAWIGLGDKDVEGVYKYADGTICGGIGATSPSYCGVGTLTSSNSPKPTLGPWTTTQPTEPTLVFTENCGITHENGIADHPCNLDPYRYQLYICSTCAEYLLPGPEGTELEGECVTQAEINFLNE